MKRNSGLLTRICALGAYGLTMASFAAGLRLDPPCNPGVVSPQLLSPTAPSLPPSGPLVTCLPNDRPPTAEERAEFDKQRDKYTNAGLKPECFSSGGVTKCVWRRPDGTVVFTGDPEAPFPDDYVPNGDPPGPNVVPINPGGGGGGAQGGGAPSSQPHDAEHEPWAGAAGTTCNPTVIATGAKINDEVDLVVALPGQNFELRRCFSPAAPMMGHTAGLGWNLSVDSYVYKADIVRDANGNPAQTRSVAYISVYAIPQRDTSIFQNDRTGGLAGTGKFFLPVGPGSTFIEEIDNFPIPTGASGEPTSMPVFRQVTFGSASTVYFRTKGWSSTSLTTAQNDKYQRLDGMIAQQFDSFGNVWTYDYDEAVESRRDPVTQMLLQTPAPRLRHVFLHGTYFGDAGMRARLDFEWDWGYTYNGTYYWRTDMLRRVNVVRFALTSESAVEECVTDSVVYTYVQDLLDIAPGGNTQANRDALRYIGTSRCLAMATRRTLLNASINGESLATNGPEIHNRFSQYRYALDAASNSLIGLKAIFYPEQFEYIAENATTDLQPSGSLGALAGEGNFVQAAAYEMLQLDDSASGDVIVMQDSSQWTPKQLAGKWMHYDSNKTLKYQLVRGGCGCGSSMREDYGVSVSDTPNKIVFPGGMTVLLQNFARIVHERACDRDGIPVSGPPLRTHIYRNEQRIIHRVEEFPGGTQAGWVTLDWSPFTTAEATFEYNDNGAEAATIKHVWVTGYEYDAQNRATERRMSSSMLSGVSSIPLPTLPSGSGDFAVNPANMTADTLNFLTSSTLVEVTEIPGYSRIAYKAELGGMAELTTYRDILSEASALDSGAQSWFGNTFGRMASLDIAQRSTRSALQVTVTEQKAFLPFSSWRPDLATVQRRLTGVAASPTVETENSYQLEAFYGTISPFGSSSAGAVLARIATAKTQTDGDGAAQNGDTNEVFSIQGYSTIGNQVWQRQSNGRLDILFHDEATGAEVMRVNHVATSVTISGQPNAMSNGPHGRALTFGPEKIWHNTEVDSFITVSIVDIMGRERRRSVDIPNARTSNASDSEVLVLQPGGHVTDTKYGLDPFFLRWSQEYSPFRWKTYVETRSTGFFASPAATSFFATPSAAQVFWLGPVVHTYLDSAMNVVCEETRESNYIEGSGQDLGRTEYSLDLSGKVSATRRWWYPVPQWAMANKFFTSSVERDALGRVRRTIDENGGITETDYDAMDRAIETRTGANESAMSSGATYSRVRMLYDYSLSATVKGGDGLLNFTVQSVGAGQPDRVRRTLYDNLSRPVADVAVESLSAINAPAGPWKLTVTDLAGRAIESGTASSELSAADVLTAIGTVSGALTNGLDGLGHLNSHEKTHYSAHRGLVYRMESAIEPGNWAQGVLRTDRWFDSAGNVQVQRSPSSPMTVYWRDLHNRVLMETSRWPELIAANFQSIPAPSQPALQRSFYSYHRGTSLVSQKQSIASSPNTSLPTVQSIIGNVYDPAGRSIAVVDYGHGTKSRDTSDQTIDDFSQPLSADATVPEIIPMPLTLNASWHIDSYSPNIPPVPSEFLSANPGVLITRQSYNVMGLPQDSIDASGRITRTLYDGLGRAVGSIENLRSSRSMGSGNYLVFPDLVAASGAEPEHWDVNWANFSGYITLGADEYRVTTSTLDGLGNTTLRVGFQRGEAVAKQFTRFIYRIDDTSGSFASAGYGSSNLLYEIRYPDPATGLASIADDQRIRYRYNQAGEQTAVIDQNATTRLFTRDSQGRLLTDAVQLPLASGSLVDSTAAAIRNAYDTSGRVSTTEMLNAASATLNKVTYEYDLLGGVKALKQVAGYAGASPLGGERVVQYDLRSEPWLASPSGVSGAYINNWRGVRGISYPDGTPSSSTDDTEIRYYADADHVGSLSSAATDAYHRFAIAQPTLLALRQSGADVGTVTATSLNPSGVKLLANVQRLGMSRTASMSLDVPQVYLDRVRSTTGKTKAGIYDGWDRFGRLKHQVWAATPTLAPTTANATPASGAGSKGWMQDATVAASPVRPLWQHGYSYSASSDRLSDDDLRPRVAGAVPDRKYTYDNLRRLTKEETGKFSWTYGVLGFTAGVGSAAESRSWSLDLLGNWKSVASDFNGDGTFAAAETSTRTHDAQNQLTSLGATTAESGTPKYLRAYDKNGNLLSETIDGDAQATRKFAYDAWNRLVRVERGPGGSVAPTPVALYSYNALNWRTVERVRWMGDAGDEIPGYTRARVFFFSSDWQVLNVLEDRHAPTTGGLSSFTPDSETQFFWGVRDKDELLLTRTRALTNSSGVTNDPVTSWTSANSVYALTDANLSIAAFVSPSGGMRESRIFDSFGRMTRCLPGDFNGDGFCDNADFEIFNLAYGVQDCTDASMPDHNGGPGGNPPTWGCPADLNGDWYVDDADFQIFAVGYNQLVPEPDALVSGNAAAGALEWGPGWNGYWYDPATGLWLSRNRWFDPVGGRWITRDPAGYVDGLSLYLYVKGNPFLFRDPSGLYTFGEMMQIGGAFVSGAARAYGQANVGAFKMVGQVAAGVIDGGGLAMDAAGTLAGYNMNYQPISSNGQAAVADTENWASQVYDNADKMKNTVASLTIADTVQQTSDYAEGKLSDDQFSQAQGATSTTAAMMATGAPGRVRGPAPVTETVANTAEPATATLPDGSFSLTSWQGYPSNVPKPSGPFRLLEGTEYSAARKVADAANRKLRTSDPDAYQGKQIHEIQPVKFGGDPVNPLNKISLSPAEHAPVTTWWNKQQSCIIK
ncbi:MAG: RHS repeat-associated core domain-containing protein [Phycisphaerales bacterium]